MKYSCSMCGKQYHPCVIDIKGIVPEAPYSCPYANDRTEVEADWKEMKEQDFEMNNASGFSIDAASAAHGFTSMSESLKSDIDAANARLKAKIKDKDYRQESIVSKNKIKIEEMIDAHWSYIESVIRTSNEYGIYRPPMSLDDALKIREFDYKTAAKHFYGHGHEDGVIDMANTTVARLRK